MNIKCYGDQIPYIIVDNLYNEEEEFEIKIELDYLCHKWRMIQPYEDSAAAKSDYKNIKNAYCKYLDSFFSERENSSILRITQKLFMNNSEIINRHSHWYFDTSDINRHFTSVVYYEDKNEYLKHSDTHRFTAVTYFYKLPKVFSGGNLTFPDYNVDIECLNNRTVIFPSMIPHASTPVIMEEQYKNQKNGKFTITQWLEHDINQ